MKVQNLSKLGLILALIAALFGGVILPANAALPPVLTVVGVYPGSMVQLRVDNMPANVEFAVTMGAAGTNGVGPTVAHFISGAGGTQTYWIEILSDVRTNATIDVRINSGTGLVAYTTFNNTSAFTAPAATSVPTATAVATSVATAVATAAPVLGTGGALTTTLRIVHVQKGGWVAVEGRNLPLSTTFTVTIGPGGSQGYGGSVMAHWNTTDSGPAVVVGTFEIPLTLANAATLDVRVEGGGFIYIITFSNVNL